MIINTEVFCGNADIRTYADFIRTSVDENPRGWKWLNFLECAHTGLPDRFMGAGYPTEQTFFLLVNDAARDPDAGASLYRRSVGNAIAGRHGIADGFSDQEILRIFETVRYLNEPADPFSIDTTRIFLNTITRVSGMYHFSNPRLWSVYTPELSCVLDTFAQDFRNADPPAADRLGDQIRFPPPDTIEGSDRAPVKFVQASLLLRCLADNLNEHDVPTGANRDWWPDHTWGLSQVAMVLSWLGEERKPREKKTPDEPDHPATGTWSLLE